MFINPMVHFMYFQKLTILKNLLKQGLKKGVVMVNGKAFGAHGKNHVRLSYATSYNQLEDAMDRLESINYKF